MKPTTRYNITGKTISKLHTDWEVVIDSKEGIKFDLRRLRKMLLDSVIESSMYSCPSDLVLKRFGCLNDCKDIGDFLQFMMMCAVDFESAIYNIYMCNNFKLVMRGNIDDVNEEKVLEDELRIMCDILVRNGEVSEDVLEQYKSM